MPGGSLYEYIHKNHIVLNLPQLLQFAIDVCSGMEYLHQNDIIHRDLKTANLLMDNDRLYYDGNNGVWYSYDHQTQQYVPCSDQNLVYIFIYLFIGLPANFQ
ncbi:Serine/threonine-protein kinase STY46 [Camellia lanceoleosa]|uniref:Serine/threonine-protein kinase STY46 n=1 Tax=Camellia lanceoleosa TaxID=1840588 RepID=A0ACC0ITM8_9ERIC|nr:Serine/threonine-protein kinase STY46 [Camellia lanceoleosa]